MNIQIRVNGKTITIEKKDINNIMLISSSHDANKVALVSLFNNSELVGVKRPILTNISGYYQNNDKYEELVENFARKTNVFYIKEFSDMLINLENVKSIKVEPNISTTKLGLCVEILFKDQTKANIYEKNNDKSKFYIKKLITQFENSKNIEK